MNIVSILDANADPSPTAWLLGEINIGSALTIIRTETFFEREDLVSRLKAECPKAHTSWLSLQWENSSATAVSWQRGNPTDVVRKLSGVTPGGFINYAKDLQPDIVIVEDVQGVPRSFLPQVDIAAKVKFWAGYITKLRELALVQQRNVVLFQRGDQYKSLTYAADRILKCGYGEKQGTWNVKITKDKYAAAGKMMTRPA